MKELFKSGKWKTVGNYINNFTHEIIFYPNKTESVIKISIVIASWLGGILVLKLEKVTEGIGSAYFLFSLSVLMEFVEKCRNKNNGLARFLLSIFIALALGILGFAFLLILGAPLSPNNINTMFRLSEVITICLLVNLFIAWNTKELDLHNQPTSQSADPQSETERQMFLTNLEGGVLGRIKKESEIND